VNLSLYLAKANNLAGLGSLVTSRANLNLGSVATFDVGAGANNIVQLDTGAKIPAYDGSQLLAHAERGIPRRQAQSAAQAELNKIYKETPPGSAGYKTKAVQDRVRQLNESIHGDGPAVGQGGRTA
jgi:hypothetical protein